MRTLKIVLGTCFLLIPVYTCALIGSLFIALGSLICHLQETSVWKESESYWEGVGNALARLCNAWLGR